MNRILLPIAWLYQGILSLRHKMYECNILSSKQFDLPVICVGNLNLGGTGKTPHTEYLIRLLSDEFRVATLSRGYGRKTKGFLLAGSDSTADDLGDEVMQYRTKFPDILVAVDEDRVEGVEKLLQHPSPPQVVLLDDAMQHRSIQAGLTILLTEYHHLYTDDCLVPAGTLRDLKSAARRADIIVVSKAPAKLDENEKAAVIGRLKPEGRQQVFFSYLEYEELRPMNNSASRLKADNGLGDSALLFCGIAHPEPLANEMKSKFRNLELMPFADHHPYRHDDIERILQRYDGLPGDKKIIVTTEKDYARLTKNPYLCHFDTVPLFVAPVRVRFHQEESINNEIKSYVRQNHHHI
ncbi:MAG: tetraacyldisaccharide 4'-kinase [Bacteroidales bacterium]|nr:tetraacyldisaccharide 4'-kinase [Bacteroidales bacterium]